MATSSPAKNETRELRSNAKRKDGSDMQFGTCAMQSTVTKTRLIVQCFNSKLSNGYPPHLDTLSKGIEVQGSKKYRFLRSIPTDPMTNSKEFGHGFHAGRFRLRFVGGQNVFDVYAKSEGTGL